MQAYKFKAFQSVGGGSFLKGGPDMRTMSVLLVSTRERRLRTGNGFLLTQSFNVVPRRLVNPAAAAKVNGSPQMSKNCPNVNALRTGDST